MINKYKITHKSNICNETQNNQEKTHNYHKTGLQINEK